MSRIFIVPDSSFGCKLWNGVSFYCFYVQSLRKEFWGSYSTLQRRCLATDRKQVRCWRHCHRSLRRQLSPTCTTRGTTLIRPNHRHCRLPPRLVRWRPTPARFRGTGRAGRVQGT